VKIKVLKASKSDWAVITFGSGPGWRPSVERSHRQAIRSRLFRINIAADDKWLKAYSFPNEKLAEFIKDNPRGYGLWIWKPYILIDVLKKFPDIDGVLYLDSGCELNFNDQSKKRMEEYFTIANSTGSLGFENPQIESNFTSPLVLKTLNAEKYLHTKQMMAGVFFLKNSKENLEFLIEWADLMSTQNHALLNGKVAERTGQITVTNSNFIEHRHDQSIFSILWKKKQMTILTDETYWHPRWKIDGKDFPIWTTRSKLFFSIKTNAILLIIYRLIRKVILIGTRDRFSI
jgi:hypothetical protein